MLYQGIIGGGSSPVEPVDLSPVLLWTNPSLGGDFAAQKVSVDLTNYVGAIIEYTSRSTASITSREFVKKSDALDTFFGSGYYDGGNGHGRNITAIDNSGITFGDNYYASTSNNGFVKPYKIYGVKEYVVEPVSPITKELLWTNPNPTSGLAKTELSGNYSKYKSLVVKAKAKADNDFAGEFNIYKNNSTTYGSGIFFVKLGVESYYRNILLTDEMLTIDVGWSGGSNSSIDSTSAIPLEIYGIE